MYAEIRKKETIMNRTILRQVLMFYGPAHGWHKLLNPISAALTEQWLRQLMENAASDR